MGVAGTTRLPGAVANRVFAEITKAEVQGRAGGDGRGTSPGHRGGWELRGLWAQTGCREKTRPPGRGEARLVLKAACESKSGTRNRCRQSLRRPPRQPPTKAPLASWPLSKGSLRRGPTGRKGETS